MGRDNKTSQPAQLYDSNIRKTIPFYDLFNDSALELVSVVHPAPDAWLDTGGGTGTLVEQAARRFPQTIFTLADPSPAMLDIAKGKLADKGDCRFIAAGTEALDCRDASFAVITAVLAHHYFDVDTRRSATANCLRMLQEGGVYITFETFLPDSPSGRQIGLECWRRAQLARGKCEAEVDKHISRYGIELFPIQPEVHLQLLRDVGFAVAELFWVSGLQAGFYALKRPR